MALYQFYNANLLDIPRESKGESMKANIGDTLLIAIARSFEDAHKKLKSMMIKEGKAIKWAKTHNSLFEYSKLALINFAHSSCRKSTKPTLDSQTLLSSEGKVLSISELC